LDSKDKEVTAAIECPLQHSVLEHVALSYGMQQARKAGGEQSLQLEQLQQQLSECQAQLGLGNAAAASEVKKAIY
jgi:hypothetical protein